MGIALPRFTVHEIEKPRNQLRAFFFQIRQFLATGRHIIFLKKGLKRPQVHGRLFFVAALRRYRKLRRSAVNRVAEKGQAIMISCLSKIENQLESGLEMWQK